MKKINKSTVRKFAQVVMYALTHGEDHSAFANGYDWISTLNNLPLTSKDLLVLLPLFDTFVLMEPTKGIEYINAIAQGKVEIEL